MAFTPNMPDGTWDGFMKVSIKPGLEQHLRKLAEQAIWGTGNQSIGGANLRTHGRTNLDETEWQMESCWTEEELTPEYQAQQIADATGENYNFVLAQTVVRIYAPGDTLVKSRAEANQDIADNREEWEAVEV